MRRTALWTTACFAVLALTLTSVATAGSTSKSVPFELNRWIELDATDGPVTLHRIRLREVSGRVTKSALFRPGNDENLQTVQIELEFSNRATRDWEADLDVRWLDRDGTLIDGYRDEESLDEDERHDSTTVTLSTLKYGLDKAKKLEIDIEFYPD